MVFVQTQLSFIGIVDDTKGIVRLVMSQTILEGNERPAVGAQIGQLPSIELLGGQHKTAGRISSAPVELGIQRLQGIGIGEILIVANLQVEQHASRCHRRNEHERHHQDT